VTVATEQDFCDLSEAFACRLAALGQFDLLQERDPTAIDAYEVRVKRMCLLLSGDDFKSPNVIAQF
jgi:hypothetical protein